jgi:hypothetical protein
VTVNLGGGVIWWFEFEFVGVVEFVVELDLVELGELLENWWIWWVVNLVGELDWIELVSWIELLKIGIG